MAINIGPRIGVDGEAQYRAQLQNIIQATKTLKAEMEQTESSFGKNASAMDKAKAKAENLTKQIDLQRQRVDQLKDMVQKSAEKYGEADTRTLKWKEALANATTELNKMEGELGGVNPKVKAMADAMAEAGNKLKAVGKKVAAVGKNLTKHVTTPILAVGTAAVKVTADFDSQMSKVSAISGAVGEDFDSLRDKAREMGAKTKFSASEAAQGFEYMAMAGWKTGDMLDGIEGIMSLAAASGEDLATTSDIVTDALTAFGLKAKDSGHFADVLAAASSNANTNVGMLGESFKYAAPVVGALGGTAEDTSIILGLMANAGIKASQAGTAMRTGLARLTDPTDKIEAAMQRYNVALVENADGSVNLRETVVQLRKNLGGLTETEQAAAVSTIFGKNAMSGWMAVINAAPEDVEKLTNAIDNCDGAAEGMANTMQDNLSGQITILKSAVQELAIQFGDALMPTIRKGVAVIQGIVEKLQGMDEGTRNAILRVAAFAAALGPVLLIGGKIAAGIGTILSFGPQIVTAFSAVAAFATGTLAPAIVAAAAAFAPLLVPAGLVVAGLVAAVVLIAKNWDKIKVAAGKLKDAVVKKWEELSKNIKAKVELIKLVATAVFKYLRNYIPQKAGEIKTNVTNTFEAIKKAVSDKFNAAKTTATNAFNAIKDKVSGAASGAKKAALDAFEGLKDGVVGKIESAKEKISSAFNKIKSIFNTTLKPKVKLPHIKISGKLSINPPEVPKLSVDWYRKAYNNPVMFTAPTVLGNKGFGDGNGAEVVIGKETMLAWIREAVSGGGDTTNYSYGDINVVVNAAPGQNVRQLADLVADRIQQRVSMRRRVR